MAYTTIKKLISLCTYCIYILLKADLHEQLYAVNENNVIINLTEFSFAKNESKEHSE